MHPSRMKETWLPFPCRMFALSLAQEVAGIIKRKVLVGRSAQDFFEEDYPPCSCGTSKANPA